MLAEAGCPGAVLHDHRHGGRDAEPLARPWVQVRLQRNGHAARHGGGGERGDGGAAGSVQHAAHAREPVRRGEVCLVEADAPLEERLHDRRPSRLAALVGHGEQSGDLLPGQPAGPGTEVARVRHVQGRHVHAKRAATIDDGGQSLQIEHGHVRRPTRRTCSRRRRARPPDPRFADFRGRDVSLTRAR